MLFSNKFWMCAHSGDSSLLNDTGCILHTCIWTGLGSGCFFICILLSFSLHILRLFLTLHKKIVLVAFAKSYHQMCRLCSAKCKLPNAQVDGSVGIAVCSYCNQPKSIVTIGQAIWWFCGDICISQTKNINSHWLVCGCEWHQVSRCALHTATTLPTLIQQPSSSSS